MRFRGSGKDSTRWALRILLTLRSSPLHQVSQQQPVDHSLLHAWVWTACELRMIFYMLKRLGKKNGKDSHHFVTQRNDIKSKFRCLSIKFYWDTVILLVSIHRGLFHTTMAASKCCIWKHTGHKAQGVYYLAPYRNKFAEPRLRPFSCRDKRQTESWCPTNGEPQYQT